jgi:hypothetical protein
VAAGWELERFALQALYQYVEATGRGDGGDVSFQAVALRGQFRF